MSNIDEFFEIIRHEYNKCDILPTDLSIPKLSLDYHFDEEINKCVRALKRMAVIRELKRQSKRSRD